MTATSNKNGRCLWYVYIVISEVWRQIGLSRSHQKSQATEAAPPLEAPSLDFRVSAFLSSLFLLCHLFLLAQSVASNPTAELRFHQTWF
ncbi:hypothetical protein M747DRAFT_33139 [Aspergillus niger ATCC 13496]|nr:hypothetical protein M747DRAFT_33139 [Aspergillus niger ATCC 13496]